MSAYFIQGAVPSALLISPLYFSQQSQEGGFATLVLPIKKSRHGSDHYLVNVMTQIY